MFGAELKETDVRVEEVVQNLTQWEFLALNSDLNVADGHARQGLTPQQSKIIADLPFLFADCERRPVEQIEAEAHRSFLTMLGQISYPAEPGRVLSCYSSSVAMEILARSLSTVSSTVGLVHPTFDNIPDLLRGNGLRLVSVGEELLYGDCDVPEALLRSVGCLFVTTPNNPTGQVVAEPRLRRMAEQCAEHDVVLALDTSFRGFDPRAQYDHYAVLSASGCRWVVIEDTGKLWPTLDLKVGLLVASAAVGLPLHKIYSDILLGVSPLVLALAGRFAEDGVQGGLAELHAFVAENRRMVRSGLVDLPQVSFPDPDSVVSVERVHLGDLPAHQIWQELSQRGVYALPCNAFHWAQPEQGSNTLRLALSRSPDRLASVVEAFRSVLAAR